MSNQVEGQSVSPNDAKPDVLRLRDLLEQKKIELQKLGRGSIKEMPYKQLMADIGAITYVLKLMEEHQPVA